VDGASTLPRSVAHAWTSDGRTSGPHALYAAADAALYQAKRAKPGRPAIAASAVSRSLVDQQARGDEPSETLSRSATGSLAAPGPRSSTPGRRWLTTILTTICGSYAAVHLGPSPFHMPLDVHG
jgi:hypothetical protein